MVQSKLKNNLPIGTELPDSDDTPVDNEEQNLIPNILLFILNVLWADRKSWYFGVDMGVYHDTGKNPRVPVVPDAFLSLGVERYKGDDLRRSYVVWEESEIVPTMTLEVVSWSPGGEYTDKLEIYRKLGVLYYIIYNPQFWQRDQHQPFEVYKLVDGQYQLQIGEPFWMPEVELGLGRYAGTVGGRPMELLGWFQEGGDRILTAEENSDYFQSKAERLAARLRELGEDPESI
jgi:Uma2 family endonuclease